MKMRYFYEIEPSPKPAFISSENEMLTYADIHSEIKRIRPLVKTRKLAFCLCENSPSGIVSYLICLNCGIVPLLFDKRIEDGLLERLINRYDPAYVFTPRDMSSKFPEWDLVRDIYGYALLESRTSSEYILHDDLALLLTTSGSTGSPKLVRQSYTNIQSNAEAIVSYLGITEEERPVTTLPMNYTYGLSIINSHILAGATIYTTDRPINFKAFWDFVRANGITSFGGVPFTYLMLKKIKFQKMDLPSLRYITQAGGKLDPELQDEFAQWAEKNGKEFVVMYGQTEATARMGYLPREMCSKKKGSMGIAIPGGQFTLIDENDKEIRVPEVVGELIYTGPNVTMGYAESVEDLAKGDERNGVLATGDMAKMDEDGYYYIVGRKKRFLKIFGNRVNLDEIDRLIVSRFGDLDCASTGTDDHMAVFITKESAAGDVKAWLSSVTHLSESAFKVIYIPEIPRNESGKVLYADLKAE